MGGRNSGARSVRSRLFVTEKRGMWIAVPDMVVVPTLVLGQGCAVLIPLWYQSMGAQEEKCRWPGAQFGCEMSAPVTEKRGMWIAVPDMVVVPTQMLGQGCAVLIPLW